MSYRIEGKDIVISGFDQGIANSPYQGISDMRSVDPISVPGEASVAFKTQNVQPKVSSATFTADATTDFLTWSGTTTSGTFANGTAITVSNSGGALPAGLTANTTYYVRNKTATTFQVSTHPANTVVDITDAGTGTQSFSTINIGTISHMCTYITSFAQYYYFAVDTSGRAWMNYPATYGNLWVFLNNASGSFHDGNGIVAWHNYLFVFGDITIDYIKISTITTGSWTTSWQVPVNSIHDAIVGQTDDVVYFCNGTSVGTWMENRGKTFDPADSTTYTYNDTALQLPGYEQAQCLGQLQTNILVGGLLNIVYMWDRLSIGYVPIFIAENGVYQIVNVNTNAYLFAGDRGRIYITNGAQAQLYKKVPDHLSGIPNPILTWGGATFTRNQLYFGVYAQDSTGTNINQYGGLWAIDLETDCLRMAAKLSYDNYSGYVTEVIPKLGSDQNIGIGLLIGWYDSTNNASGIDVTMGTPYSNGASYIDSDIIPIGTFFKPYTGAQVEWKVSVPIGSLTTSETVALYYATDENQSFTLIGTTSSSAGKLSDAYTVNFEKAQWVKIRAVLTSNATTPTYCRLTEIRLRETQ